MEGDKDTEGLVQDLAFALIAQENETERLERNYHRLNEYQKSLLTICTVWSKWFYLPNDQQITPKPTHESVALPTSSQFNPSAKTSQSDILTILPT